VASESQECSEPVLVEFLRTCLLSSFQVSRYSVSFHSLPKRCTWVRPLSLTGMCYSGDVICSRVLPSPLFIAFFFLPCPLRFLPRRALLKFDELLSILLVRLCPSLRLHFFPTPRFLFSGSFPSQPKFPRNRAAPFPCFFCAARALPLPVSQSFPSRRRSSGAHPPPAAGSFLVSRRSSRQAITSHFASRGARHVPHWNPPRHVWSVRQLVEKSRHSSLLPFRKKVASSSVVFFLKILFTPVLPGHYGPGQGFVEATSFTPRSFPLLVVDQHFAPSPFFFLTGSPLPHLPSLCSPFSLLYGF